MESKYQRTQRRQGEPVFVGRVRVGYLEKVEYDLSLKKKKADSF